MKNKLLKYCDYYPFIFVLATLLYSVVFFARISKYVNVAMFLLSLGVLYKYHDKIKLKKLILEILTLIAVVISIIVGKDEYLINNIEKLVLCFIQLIVLLNFNLYSKKTQKNINLIYWAVILFSFIFGTISLFAYLFRAHGYLLTFEIGNIGRDLVGVYTHPNIAGIVAAFSIIFAYVFLQKRHLMNDIKLFLVINVVIQTLIILLAHSNASIVFILVFFVFNFIFKQFKNKRGITLNSFAFAPLLTEILSKLANGRFELWYLGYLIIKNHIWFGVSPSGVTPYAKYYAGINGSSYAIEKGGLHNSYIQLFSGVGVVGGLCMLSVILKKLMIGFKNVYKNRISLAICLAILVYGIFESTIFFQAQLLPTIFWIFLGNMHAK